MPRIRTLRSAKPPEGWDLIEPTLSDINTRLREAEREPHEGKRRCESLWPILRLHHQRSRYLYDLYFVKGEISKDLYDYCVKEGWADKNLIAKWKKGGYEHLCCLRCIQTSDSHFGTTCICRVPRRDLEEDRIVECVHCGCRGCASGDV